MTTPEIHRSHPLRIQRRRTAGYRMPKDAVYVGRPTKWGNPFRTADEFRRLLEAILGITGQSEFHEVSLHQFAAVNRIANELHEIRGKRLVCWCSLESPCHADVLAELANRTCVNHEDSQ